MSRRAFEARARAVASPDDLAALLPRMRPLRAFRPGARVRAADRMQTYEYRLVEPPGRAFARGFRPALTPAAMLRAGVFSGRYLCDCAAELPREWFAGALRARRLAPSAPGRARADARAGRLAALARLNAFGVASRLTLGEWRRRGWVPLRSGARSGSPRDPDVRGWFQWYCRYWLGRRLPGIDEVQIARWRAFARHAAQVRASARRLGARAPRTRAAKRRHRPRQRQALLQWAYDPWI